MDAVRPGMIERKRGAIVNIIGMGGKAAQPVFLSGGAANAALMLATVGWANALGRYGIRVNGINPGTTLTDRVKRGVEAEAQAQDRKSTRLNSSHLGISYAVFCLKKK